MTNIEKQNLTTIIKMYKILNPPRLKQTLYYPQLPGDFSGFPLTNIKKKKIHNRFTPFSHVF